MRGIHKRGQGEIVISDIKTKFSELASASSVIGKFIRGVK